MHCASYSRPSPAHVQCVVSSIIESNMKGKVDFAGFLPRLLSWDGIRMNYGSHAHGLGLYTGCIACTLVSGSWVAAVSNSVAWNTSRKVVESACSSNACRVVRLMRLVHSLCLIERTTRFCSICARTYLDMLVHV
eukprot:4377847-Amphidinium_carterae.1